MTEEHPERTELTPEEQAFVRRVGAIYAPPEMSGEARVAFQARLEERLASARRGHLRAVLSGAAVAAGAALLLLTLVRTDLSRDDATPRVAQREAVERSAVATPEEALLALATEPVADAEAAFPDDYLAIESLFLDG